MKTTTITALVLGLLLSASSLAAVVAQSSAGTVRVILTDEPCKLPVVTNLPFRAQWLEGKEKFEGCWAPSSAAPVVMAYFDDKTVAVIPMQFFQEVQSL